MTRLLHLSDLHFGAEVAEAVEALVRSAAELRPDAILIGGDFTMRARRREWAAARAFLQRLEAPTLSIPGNHDIPGFNHPWHRLVRPFQRYREAIDAELEPVATFGEVEVAGLNSARRFGAPSFDWSLGAVSVAQCLGLPRRFQEETPLRAVIVHHPMSAPEGQQRKLLKRDGLLLAALEQARVDLLLAGHFHRSHVGLLKTPQGTGDVVLSHVSTACSWRTQGEPMGFHLIEAAVDRLVIRRYRFASGGFAEFAAERFSRVPGVGWRAADWNESCHEFESP